MELVSNHTPPDCALCLTPFFTYGHPKYYPRGPHDSVNQYALVPANSNLTFKRPYLLHCGHSACEQCLRKEFGSKTKVSCNVCKEESKIPANLANDELIQFFPLNYFLMGLWSTNSSTTRANAMDAFIAYSKPRTSKPHDRVKSVTCSECMLVPAQFQCKQCGAPFCDCCFKAVHQVARALRSHTKVPLFESFLEVPALMCDFHAEGKLEFYCLECNVTICSRCMIENHQGHRMDLLENLKENCEEEFVERYTKVANLLLRLKSSHQIVDRMVDKKRKSERPTTQMHDEIFNTFITLHGKLNVIQNQLHLKLESVDEVGQLESIMRSLHESVTSTESLLMSAQILLRDSNFKKPCNMMAIIGNLKKKEDQECFLLEENVSCTPRLIIKDELIKSLEEICQVELPEGEKYKLVSEAELPADYKKAVLCEITQESVMQMISNFGASSEVSSILSDGFSDQINIGTGRSISPSSSTCSALSIPSATSDSLKYPDELAIGCVMRVMISHLVSPSDFYVQRECAIKKLAAFQVSLKSAGLFQQKSPQRLEKGQLYLVLYEKDSKWYRARVLEMVKNNSFKVLYIDFGNTEIVSKNRFRMIPKTALNMPYLVTRCKLNNCSPVDTDGGWDPAAIALMTKIINNSYVSMVIVEKTHFSTIVDLYKISDHAVINIKEALVFFEYASRAVESEFKPLPSLQSDLPKEVVLPREIYSTGAIFEVHVCRVVSPYEFYVQNLSSSKRLIRMSEELNRMCNNPSDTKNVFNPKKGMFVAAQYSKDNKWYRARILECLKGRNLKVYFVDFGGVEDVHWDKVKLLNFRFANVSPQAIKCKLCHISPSSDSEEWDSDACSTLIKLIFRIRARIVIQSVDGDLLSVVFYKSQTDVDICINALLVREGKAVSTGPHSVEIEHPKVVPKVYAPKKEVVAEEKLKVIPVAETPVEPPPIEIPEENPLLTHIVKGPDGSLRIHVTIKRLVNPGEFYVTFSHYAEDLAKLENDLQIHYDNYEGEPKELEAEDTCVVKHNSKWFRAHVLEKLDGDKYKLNLIDEGTEIECEKGETRGLDESFLKVRDGVLRCHLGGLKPCLVEGWSSSSTNEMEDFRANHKEILYISKMGDPIDSSMPVELFARIEKEGGPTQPTTHDWKSLNHYLRYIGLAKSDDTVQWDCDGNILNRHALDQANDENSDLESILLRTLKLLISKPSESLADEAGERRNAPSAMISVPDSWIPVKPLEELSFVASPTYVDSDGIIYFHDFHRSSILLEEISEALSMKYNGTLPKPSDMTLQEGDICVTQYHVDKKWYRGVIIKANPEYDEFDVKFVDYGNTETCKLAELRRIPVCQHIPIQASRGQFTRIEPIHADGKWKKDDLETIQYNLVDYHCQVELVPIPGKTDFYGIKNIYLPDKTDFISLLVKTDRARYKKNSSVDTDISDSFVLTSEKEIILSCGGGPEGDRKAEAHQTDGESSSSDAERPVKRRGGGAPPKLPKIDWFSMVELEEQGSDSNSTEDERPRTIVKSSGTEEESDIMESTPSSIAMPEIEDDEPDLIHWTFLQKYSPYKDGVKFKELAVPEDIELLLVEATAFHSPTIFICHLCDVEANLEILAKLEKFRELSKNMQEEWSSQPLLTDPFKYKACIAQFSGDGQWYRAFILDHSLNGQLLVEFVDFGNVEPRPVSCIREIKEEWGELEVFGLVCELDGILPNPELSPADILEQLPDYLQIGQLKAIVKERSPKLKVTLYSGRDLAYEKLIDQNVYKLL